MKKRFSRILVANRGEIAVRVIRACREMGISPVAIYSTVDREGLHVRLADEAILIGPPAARESYLKIDAVIDAAKQSGAEAIHPGYGFLSENAEFAEACEKAGIVFIGPPASAIRSMGNKIGARKLMQAAGVPITPGTGLLPEGDAALKLAREVGFPMMIKAAAGGGGKGMRVVRAEGQLAGSLESARSEARTAFGDGSVYVERYVDRPRHIEVQVLADQAGNVIHLGERECSIQRRHQKVLEECPSPVVDAATRERIGAIAVQAARAVNYVGAGTIEMLRGDDGSFYFMEMNTRLQVEHPVTEMVTGIDLVRAQIGIAGGGPLPCTQEQVVLRGHAIECRVYAEDPARGFLPSPGRIGRQRVPSGPFVRLDGCAYPGYDVPIHYDPMISKLAAWGATRAEAADRMRRALDEYRIQGIRTTIPFHRRLVRQPAFLAADLDTHFIERFRDELLAPPPLPPEIETVALIAAAVSVAQRFEGLSAAVESRPDSAWKRAARREALRGDTSA